MPEDSLLQCLGAILRKRQRAGLKSVWLSEANRRLLGTRAVGAPQARRNEQSPANSANNTSAALKWQIPDSSRPAPPPVTTPAPRQANISPAAMPAVPPPPRPAVSSPGPACAQRSPDYLQAVQSADWNSLCELVSACHACQLATTRNNLVFEDGFRQARLMFIGEGPGQDEDLQGVPFVGRAGQLLTNMIKAMGLDRNSQNKVNGVYIANIVKCRPPQNRNPLPEESTLCLPFLKRQIELVKPECIILLGAVALKGLLGLTGISKLRGTWLEYEGIPVMPTFHPSYILRCERQPTLFLEEKRKVWSDLQAVMARLNLPKPKR